GVYRSSNGGRAGGEGDTRLPSEVGFVAAPPPRDPGGVWVIPLPPPQEGRFAPGGQLAPWRAADRGDTWQRQPKGLPQENAWVGAYREALSTDANDPAGVYFGTSTGQLYGSSDEGASWARIADNLPPIWGVQAIEVD